MKLTLCIRSVEAPSAWAKLKESASLVVVIGGAVYAAYQLYDVRMSLIIHILRSSVFDSSFGTIQISAIAVFYSEICCST